MEIAVPQVTWAKTERIRTKSYHLMFLLAANKSAKGDVNEWVRQGPNEPLHRAPKPHCELQDTGACVVVS